jgi:hypothetical protein
MFDGELLESWRDAPRSRLVRLCAENSHLCDAKFTSISQSTVEAAKEIMEELGLSNDSEHWRFLDYKYVIVADGNAAPSSRLALQLFSNSLVMMQETPWFEGYYRGLRPYVHYLPLSSTFLDLPEKVQWAQNHDTQVRRMIRKARDFANSYLVYKVALMSFSKIMIEYSKLVTELWTNVNDPHVVEVTYGESNCVDFHGWFEE